MTPEGPGVSEDCLYLNIWTPADLAGAARPAPSLPVLFYIYGGGFNEGSGAVAVYNGVNLAKKGLVVVNVNYRVGSLGFMAHPELTAEQGGASGNYGIQDQIAALQWVRDNITAFGGDPAKVTLAGQSAGAMSEQALLISPMAKGLFRGAIIQSPAAPGTNGNYTPRATAEQSAVAAFGRAGVASIKDARALPAAQANTVGGRGGLVADGRVVPETSGAHPFASDVPVMIGYTLNDLFVSRAPVTAESWKAEAADRYGDRAAEFLKFYPGATDEQAARSAQREAADRGLQPEARRLARDSGGDEARVRLPVHPRGAGTRIGTLRRLPHVRRAVRIQHAPPVAGTDFTDVDRRLADQFSSYVANFVKTGDPNGGSLPKWPALTAENKSLMELGDRVAVTRAVPAGADAVIAAGKPPAVPARGGGAGRGRGSS